LKKRNFDPTTWRTTSMWCSTQKVRATQNFIKDKMNGRVDILWRIYEKIAKKLKMKSQEQKKRRFWLIYLKNVHKSTFLGPVTSILTFLQFSQKCVRLYGPFSSLRLLWKFL
jgi:hypothetical protein